jgi:adenylyl-sulfate kinase
VLWFLGLSGSGKSTLAAAAAADLRAGRARFDGVERWELLDGDEVRGFLGLELGYSFADRRRSVRIVGLLAHHLSRNGIGVVVANISPFHDLRRFFRETIPGYLEIYCRCAISTCVKRDPKGHYARQLAEGVKDYIGLDIPFQEPEAPDLVVDTERLSVEESLEAMRRFVASASRGRRT